MPMRRIGIFGVGLIGGSFALALRQAGFEGEILGVSSTQTITAALSLGVIDRGVEADEALDSSDLVYLAQPIFGILDTLAAIGPKLRKQTLITDAGSTKKQIADQAGASVSSGFFVGGHPMAGKERAGVQNADPNLFQGRPYVLCPQSVDDVTDPRFQDLQHWITRIGARPVVLDAAEHDRLVAFTSHAPQILSTALASVLSEIEGAAAVAGPGVQELTRLALSPFSIWRDIFKTNESNVAEALSLLISRLEGISKTLGSEALGEEFRKAASGAEQLRRNPGK